MQVMWKKKKDYQSLENEKSSATSRLHAEETKLAAFAGCNVSIAKLSAQLGMRFESFRMLYRDAISQNSLVDKTYRHFYPFFSLSLPVKNVEMGLSMTTKVKRQAITNLETAKNILTVIPSRQVIHGYFHNIRQIYPIRCNGINCVSQSIIKG